MTITSDPTAVNSTLETTLASGAWQLDRARSSVAFHVRHFYGLMTVKGTFADFDGELDLGATPSVELRAPSKLIVHGRLVRREGDR